MHQGWVSTMAVFPPFSLTLWLESGQLTLHPQSKCVIEAHMGAEMCIEN
jgi:hypothetical protein